MMLNKSIKDLETKTLACLKEHLKVMLSPKSDLKVEEKRALLFE